MIMKERLRGREWLTVAQFKADIQAEWDRISMAQSVIASKRCLSDAVIFRQVEESESSLICGK